MQTEEIHRTATGRDPHEVSRALQEHAPLCCEIVTRRGRPAPLSSAGYVLRFGHSYRLRFVSPFQDEDVQEVRIIDAPSFLKVEPEIRQADEQGRLVRCIPFKVQFGMSPRSWLSVRADELEVVHSFKPGIYRDAASFSLPIVVRPVWLIVFVAILTALVGYIVQRLVVDVFFSQTPQQHLIDSLQSVEKWLWVVGAAALIWLVVNVLNLIALYRRGRELRHAYREKYPPAA
jgi:hypothetical protein